MRTLFLRLLWVALGCFGMECSPAQTTANPFDLQPRLGRAVLLVDSTLTAVWQDTTAANQSSNPFDLRAAVPLPAGKSAQGLKEVDPSRAAVEKQAYEPPQNSRAWLLGIVIGGLLLTTVSLTFFRTLYIKCYKAALNDNMLNQLFREREGSGLLPFAFVYVIFLYHFALFLYQLNELWSLWGQQPIQLQIPVIAAITLLALLLKHITLAILGYIFPVTKESRLHSFTIMVFVILVGLVLTPLNLLLTYSPADWQEPVIWIGVSLLVILYLLHAARGMVIANRFIFLYQFHFLLYLCVIEIMPVLYLYKLMYNGLS
jgi:hypothetical protein